MTTFRRLWNHEAIWSTLLIILVSACAYLPLVSQLGYYREDWYLIWSGETRSLQSFLSLFESDRPFVGYIYQFTYPMLGATPLNWHLLSFGLRLTGILAFFWLLRTLWPRQSAATTIAALLFAVYPGYLQQYNAVNKTFWLAALMGGIVSLALTVYALHSQNRLKAWLAHGLALVLAAVYPLIIEFYIGLEAVRLILIWYILWQRANKPYLQTLLRALLRYSPYLLSVASFLYWRVFVFKSTRPTTSISRLVGEYFQLPLHMGVRLFVETVQDFIETVFLAWTVPPYLLITRSAYTDAIRAGLLGLFAGLLVYLYLNRLPRHSPDDPASTRSWWVAFIWIGAAAVLITLLPLILAGREVSFSLGAGREDHYTIQAALGAVLLLVGLVHALVQPRYRSVIFCLLIAGAVNTHFLNAVLRTQDWNTQLETWWQISWRVPQLADGTVLLIDLPSPFGFNEHYEAWAPANLIYAPEAENPRITAEVLSNDVYYLILRGASDAKRHRGIRLPRDYANTLMISLPTNHSCLNVIDGNHYELSPGESALVRQVAPFSRIDLVVTDTAFRTPPEVIFGREPQHTWCYYYQKAAYARQVQDWQTVVKLGDEARQLGFKPDDRIEWMPFLEGYVHLEREPEARLIAETMKAEPGPREEAIRQLRASPIYSQSPIYLRLIDFLKE